MTLVQDLRYAIRGLARSPGFTAVATATLALGIGVNTAIVSLVDAVMVRPIPGVADPARLVWIVQMENGRPGRLSYPDAADYRDHAGVFEGVAALDETSVHATIGSEPERLSAEVVGGDYFSVLGLVPAAGRFFTADDERRRAPVAVLSFPFWQRRLGGDPGVVGRTLAINGRPWTVLGIAPPHFLGLDLDNAPQVVLPLETWAEGSGHAGELASREAVRYRAIGRLKAGVTPAEARAAVSRLAAASAPLRRPERRRVDATVETPRGWTPPGHLGELLPMAAVGFAASGLVLLIACANVANLLLSRAAARRTEMRIRVAIGASRGRIVRQLLTESVLLAALGAIAGALLASWALDLFLPRFDVPAGLEPTLDATVLVYSLVVAVGTGVLFGLAPAWSASRVNAARAGGVVETGSGGVPGQRLQGVLVAGQLAVSLVLLAAAGLFLRSLGKATAAPIGLDRSRADRVGTLTFDLATQGYSAERARAFCAGLLERVGAEPGVRAVALAQTLPLGNRAVGANFWAEGGRPDRPEVVFFNRVSPGYFDALGVRLIAGRGFTAQDREGAPRVAIVNETLARRFWPGESPIGRRLMTNRRTPEAIEVVGVAADGKYMSLTEDPQPYAYFPILQATEGFEETILFAWKPSGPAPTPEMRGAVRALDPGLPALESGMLSDVLHRNLSDRRQGTLVVAAFGALALALAAVGLSGVVGYAVARRRREIGIRMALGADRREVVLLFLGRGARLAGAGVAVGLVLSAGLMRLLSTFLFGVTPLDLTTLAAVSVLLAAIALLASAVPARRAASVSPIEALRTD